MGSGFDGWETLLLSLSFICKILALFQKRSCLLQKLIEISLPIFCKSNFLYFLFNQIKPRHFDNLIYGVEILGISMGTEFIVFYCL